MPTGVWICPSCAREFLEPDADCPECGLAAVSPDELRLPESAKDEGWRYLPVGRLLHPEEEEALAGLFESRRIPLAIRGDGTLLVPGSRQEEARALIRGFRGEEQSLAGDLALAETEEAEPIETGVEEDRLPQVSSPREAKAKAEGPETRLSLSFSLRSVRPWSLGRGVDLLRWISGVITEVALLRTLWMEWAHNPGFGVPDLLGLLFFLGLTHALFFIRRDVAITVRGLEFRLWIPPPITYRRVFAEDIEALSVASELIEPPRRRERKRKLYRVEARTRWGRMVVAGHIRNRGHAYGLAERWAEVLGCGVLSRETR